MRRVRAPLAVLAVVALAAAGCGSSEKSGSKGVKTTGSPTQTYRITMKDIQFSPRELKVKAGRGVTWRNDESVPHNVVAKSGASFKSKTFGEGGSFTYHPKKAGTIKYVCTIHPGMEGTLKVTR